MTAISRMTTGHSSCCWTMHGKWFSGTDIIRACRELTGRGVRKISPEQVKAMLHGNAQEEMEESMESPVLPAQQENIEREAVDMLEGITALMTGYNEAHDIIPTI